MQGLDWHKMKYKKTYTSHESRIHLEHCYQMLKHRHTFEGRRYQTVASLNANHASLGLFTDY